MWKHQKKIIKNHWTAVDQAVNQSSASWSNLSGNKTKKEGGKKEYTVDPRQT